MEQQQDNIIEFNIDDFIKKHFGNAAKINFYEFYHNIDSLAKPAMREFIAECWGIQSQSVPVLVSRKNGVSETKLRQLEKALDLPKNTFYLTKPSRVVIAHKKQAKTLTT